MNTHLEVVEPVIAVLMPRIQSKYSTSGVKDSNLHEERQLYEWNINEIKAIDRYILRTQIASWAAHHYVVRRRSNWILSLACFLGCQLISILGWTLRDRKHKDELLARFVTLPTTSAIGNEARIILAELEGPDGLYFRAACREKGFMLHFDDDVITSSFYTGEHPQLSLQPRLLNTTHRRGFADGATQQLPPRTVVRGVDSEPSDEFDGD